jgi:hypothetical protein
MDGAFLICFAGSAGYSSLITQIDRFIHSLIPAMEKSGIPETRF